MAEMYQQLAADYHLFFPARQAQLDMISSLADPQDGTVLDVGSGTGEYVCALVNRGYDAAGIELDEAMHARATARHQEILLDATGRPRLIVGDMLRLDKYFQPPLNLVFCIGNTLAHLGSEAEVASAIDAMWKLTRPDGCVLIQLVNFNHVLRSGQLVAVSGQQRVADRDSEPAFIYDLPTLTATRDDGTRIEFARQFMMRRAADLEDPGSPPEKLIFHTRIKAGQQAGDHYNPLMLLTSDRLKFCLPRDASRTWYGDFAGAEWTDESPASIIVLR